MTRNWHHPLALMRIAGEGMLLVGLTLLLSHWLAPRDPFGIHAAFPWPWLTPLLLALRYGTIDGAFSVCLMLGAGFCRTANPPSPDSRRPTSSAAS
ncbi:MAG: hypothetical protein R3E48_12040 [Burkholderiaceae bacterium]